MPLAVAYFERELRKHDIILDELSLKPITPEEVEKRLRAWADVTLLSLELKRAALREKYPSLGDQEIADRIREQHAEYGRERNER